MDQAALQRITLVRASGTLCWTVWGAREAAKPAHMYREFLFRISGYSAGPLVGRVAFILDFQVAFGILQCTAGTLLRRRHSESTWTVLRIPFSLAPSRQCMFWWWVYSYGSLSSGTATRCWPCLIVPGSVSFWLGTLVMATWDTLDSLVAGDGWSRTWPLWLHYLATEPLPTMGRDTKTPGRQCHLPPAIASPAGTCS